MTSIDPRTVRTREIVVAATAELLAAHGFERITIEAIAEHSGVARSTIYRNWPERAELLIAGFDRLCSFPQAPDTGSLRQDLRLIGDELARGLTDGDWGRALPSLVGAVAHDDLLGSAAHRFALQRRAVVAAVFERAAARGEITSEVAAEILAELFAARLFHRHLMTGEPVDADLVDQQTELVLRVCGHDHEPGGKT